MKIIKLDNRHRLKRLGYTHAMRFDDSWSDGVRNCRRALTEMFGALDWKTNKHPAWATYDTNKRRPDNTRPYYIGVRDESVLTMLVLQVPGL